MPARVSVPRPSKGRGTQRSNEAGVDGIWWSNAGILVIISASLDPGLGMGVESRPRKRGMEKLALLFRSFIHVTLPVHPGTRRNPHDKV